MHTFERALCKSLPRLECDRLWGNVVYASPCIGAVGKMPLVDITSIINIISRFSRPTCIPEVSRLPLVSGAELLSLVPTWSKNVLRFSRDEACM